MIDLRVERDAFLIHLGELAGENDAQFGAHFVAQLGIALSFAGLALERVHLARDFFENVIDAVQVRLCIFESRFGETFFRLEFRDARCLFNNRPAVGRTAAEDLANASLLDERIGLRPKAGAHEEFLNVAQAAEFSIQQVFAVAAAEQAARHGNFSGMVLLLVEFAAADLENNLRSGDGHGGRGVASGCFAGRSFGGDCALDFFCFSGLRFFHGLFGFCCGVGADLGFVPIFVAG